MIETGLVYIHFDRSSSGFVGCGALVEGPFVVTCRHVWDQALEAARGGPVIVCFPSPQGLGETVFAEATLADGCQDGARPPDLVILEAAIPAACAALSVERTIGAEIGPAAGLAVLYGRDPATPMLELTIPGTISSRIAPSGLRQFTGSGSGLWFDHGSSGSPFGLQGGTTLAGILCRSETGAQPGAAMIHEAFLLPASTIHRFLRAYVGRRVAEARDVDAAKMPEILDMLGAPDLPLAELRRRLDAYFTSVEMLAAESMAAESAEAAAPARDGLGDTAAVLTRSRALSAGFEPAAALAVLDEALAEEARVRLRRTRPLLAEKLRQQQLLLDRQGMVATLIEITALDPDTPQGWIDLGDAQRFIGNHGAALSAYQACLDLLHSLAIAEPEQAGLQQDLSLAHERIGDVLLTRGSRSGALTAFRASLSIREALAALDPTNVAWQQNLATAHQRVGDFLRQAGDLSGALAEARASLAIARQIAERDPQHGNLQRELSVSYNKVGFILVLQNDPVAALENYNAGLVIMQQICAQDAGQTDWQQDLSISHERIGGVLLGRGELSSALLSFQASLEIRGALCARDPGNTEWQRALAISHIKIGDTLREQAGLDAAADDGTRLKAHLDGALESFRAMLAIMEPLAARDHDHAEWMRDVAVGHNKIGDILRSQGDVAGALAAFRTGLEIAQHLANRDPDAAEWQRDLLVSCVKMAAVDLAGQRVWLVRALAIATALAQAGRLAPIDAWMIPHLQARLQDLPPDSAPVPG